MRRGVPDRSCGSGLPAAAPDAWGPSRRMHQRPGGRFCQAVHAVGPVGGTGVRVSGCVCVSSGAAAVLVGPRVGRWRRSVLCICQIQAGMPGTSAGLASDAGRSCYARCTASGVTDTAVQLPADLPRLSSRTACGFLTRESPSQQALSQFISLHL